MSRPVRVSVTPFLPGPADHPILVALGRYYYLTARQLTRLLYAPSSQTYAQARLKRLVDHAVLQRIFLPRPTRTGSAPLAYTLARKGLHALVEWGGAGERRYRPAEVRETSYLYLAHTLALNDVLIALELLCRRDPRVELAALRHERELKCQPVRISLPGGATTSVIPDAWVDLRLLGRYQECYAIELDRGTTEQRAWRRKVAALIAYASGPYQERFGTASLTIAVVATSGKGRRDQLIRWTEAELRSHGHEHQANLFRFTGVPIVDTDPIDVFAGSVWHRPFDPHPTPLLGLSDVSWMVEKAEKTDISEISDNTEQSSTLRSLSYQTLQCQSTPEVVEG